jgi:hypothetical protein
VSERTGGGGAAGFSWRGSSGVGVLELVVIVNCARSKHNKPVGLGKGQGHLFLSEVEWSVVE